MTKEEYLKLWIKKADGDLKVAKRELQFDDAVLDAVCFHLQQAVEKYLKVFLINSSGSIEKTHNLEFLIEQCIKIDESFREFEEKFDQIADCGVEIRYPDTFLTVEVDGMFEMVEIVENLKQVVLKKTGLTEG